jgi:two-component system response regulator YesN
MIKVMIVDDEHIVREGIKYILEKDFAELTTIVHMAKTGREAIEKFEELRPQLVIMDIQMPGINGIDATKEIRSIDQKVRVVIVSAYEQFEYAKDAVKLGAVDYLLKPINRQNLKKIVQKSIDDINEEKSLKKKERETQEKLDQVVPVLEIGYIYSVLMNHDYQNELSKYHHLLNIQKEKGYIMIIEFGDGNNLNELENRIGVGVRSNTLYQNIRHCIKYKCHAIVGPLMVNRIILAIHEDERQDEYQGRLDAIELAERICGDVENIIGTNVYIGIGSRCAKEQLNISYNEALKAINQIEDEHILHIGDMIQQKNIDTEYTFSKVKNDIDFIIKKVEEGRRDDVDKALKWFLAKVHKAYHQKMDLVKNIVTEMFVLIFSMAYSNGYEDIEILHLKYLEKISQVEDFYALQNWCISELLMLTDAMRQTKETQVSAIIKDAMAYMTLNYNQELRLKDVAELVQISPQYFSKIFKDDVGVNFIEYLTQLRMDKAKEMLKESNRTIKEICFEIGYNDPNYFSRLFKKNVGVSPTDFV